MPEEEYQRVRSGFPPLELDLEPEQPDALWVGNVMERRLVYLVGAVGDTYKIAQVDASGQLRVTADPESHLYGDNAGTWTEVAVDGTGAVATQAGEDSYLYADVGGTWTKLQGTAEGELRVSGREAIPEDVDVSEGDAANTYPGMTLFSGKTQSVDVLAETSGLDVRFNTAAATPTTEIYVPADTWVSLPIRADAWEVKEHTTDGGATYEVIGYIAT